MLYLTTTWLALCAISVAVMFYLAASAPLKPEWDSEAIKRRERLRQLRDRAA